MRLRAEYRVGASLRFLAALDLMNLMTRALRRAGIPYALSEGYNPQVRMSLGTVLPVGLWGEKEYLDLDLAHKLPVLEFMEKMNQVLPSAVKINRCREIDPAVPALMKIVNTAVYTFVLTPDLFDWPAWADGIMDKDKLPVSGRGKKKGILKDLRPGLYKIEILDPGKLDFWVSSGELLNVRFDELQDIIRHEGVPASAIGEVYRAGNYIKQGDEFISPWEMAD